MAAHQGRVVLVVPEHDGIAVGGDPGGDALDHAAWVVPDGVEAASSGRRPADTCRAGHTYPRRPRCRRSSLSSADRHLVHLVGNAGGLDKGHSPRTRDREEGVGPGRCGPSSCAKATSAPVASTVHGHREEDGHLRVTAVVPPCPTARRQACRRPSPGVGSFSVCRPPGHRRRGRRSGLGSTPRGLSPVMALLQRSTRVAASGTPGCGGVRRDACTYNNLAVPSAAMPTCGWWLPAGWVTSTTSVPPSTRTVVDRLDAVPAGPCPRAAPALPRRPRCGALGAHRQSELRGPQAALPVTRIAGDLPVAGDPDGLGYQPEPAGHPRRHPPRR